MAQTNSGWTDMPMSADQAQAEARRLLDMADKEVVERLIAEMRELFIGLRVVDACVAVAQAAGIVFGVSLGPRNAQDAAPLSIICQAAWDIAAEEAGRG